MGLALTALTAKGQSGGFSRRRRRMQFGVGSGLTLNQSNMGSLSETHCVRWKLQYSFSIY